MTSINSLPQPPGEDDNRISTSRMNISFLLTAANAAEAVDEKKKCWSESTSQLPPTTQLHECDEMKWQPTPPNSSQSSPSSSYRLDINIRLPPIRLLPPEHQQDDRQPHPPSPARNSSPHDLDRERQPQAFPQQQKVQLPTFRTIETSSLQDLEQIRQQQVHELMAHWNSTTFQNPRNSFPQNDCQRAQPLLQLQQQQQDIRLRADHQTQEYHSPPNPSLQQTQPTHHSIPISRSTRSPHPGRRPPRASRHRTSRHRHLTPSPSTHWHLPIPIHTPHAHPTFESLAHSRAYPHPYPHPHPHSQHQLQAPPIHAQDSSTHYDSQASPSSGAPHPQPPHSNKAYPLEQVDWIRYQKDDCGIAWNDMLILFHQHFPDERLSDQCLSSRYYRDNRVPLVEWIDVHGAVYGSSSISSTALTSSPDGGNGNGGSELHAAQTSDGIKPHGVNREREIKREIEERIPRLVRDEKGRVKWMSAKVRDRASEEGKELGIPFHLVDKHPERAVAYAWVREEHKVLARGVLEGRHMGDLLWNKKAEWRLVLRMVEQEEHMSGGVEQGNMQMHVEMQQ